VSYEVDLKWLEGMIEVVWLEVWRRKLKNLKIDVSILNFYTLFLINFKIFLFVLISGQY
jgi:hypothetical protein